MSTEYLQSLFSVSGKTAIITGATGGLGSAIAVGLASAGADIVSIELPNDPLSSSLAEKINKTGRILKHFPCDIGDAKNLRESYNQIWDAGVSAEILVNVAGVMARNKCEDATDEELDFIMNVNQRATYISMQEFGRRRLALDLPGRIINISSVTAFQANINTSVYGSTKGAVVQMTKSFSNEWAGRGINVNAIAPGFMRTSMTEVYAKNETQTAYLMSRVPMARWGQPEDLVGAVIYLSSPASAFTTGATLVIDGGFCGK